MKRTIFFMLTAALLLLVLMPAAAEELKTYSQTGTVYEADFQTDLQGWSKVSGSEPVISQNALYAETLSSQQEDGTYLLSQTRIHSPGLNLQVFPGRKYTLSETHRKILGENAASNAPTSLLNGVVLNNTQVDYSTNHTEYQTTVTNQHYWYPSLPFEDLTVSQDYWWKKEGASELKITEVFFIIFHNKAQATDVWGGKMGYYLKNFKIEETITYHEISAKISGAGTVAVNKADADGKNALNQQLTDGQIFAAEEGTSPVFTITPQEGYRLARVLINGEATEYYTEQQISLTLSSLSEPTEVEAVFEEIPAEPETPYLSMDPYLIEGEQEGQYCVTAYSTLVNQPDWSLEKYGMNLYHGSDCLFLPGPEGLTNGKFGIKMYGKAFVPGQTYQIESTATFQNSQGEKLTVFGQERKSTTVTQSSTLEDVQICTFYQNKPAAVSLTFDSNTLSHGQMYDSVLQQYNMKGTFLAVVNWMKKDLAGWKQMVDAGRLDICNHSVNHAVKYGTATEEELAEDISGAHAQLCEMFPQLPILTFGAPWGTTTDASIAEMKKLHYANRKAGGDKPAPSSPTETEWFLLPCYSVQNTVTAQQMNGWTDTAIEQQGWAIEMYHEIEDLSETSYPYGTTKQIFADHMAYLNSKQDQVWCGSFQDVTAYIRERQNAQVSATEKDSHHITVTLTDSLPDDLFFHPLTLKINLPEHWSGSVSCTQGSTVQSKTVVTENEKNYVYVDLIPDGGEAILTLE
ncbi:MAG: polysaccharide deacetylase family protein [Clostridia bacterium]|nr:polysaccharide deacetylase family protein [Clostridia bacterium]